VVKKRRDSKEIYNVRKKLVARGTNKSDGTKRKQLDSNRKKRALKQFLTNINNKFLFLHTYVCLLYLLCIF